MKLSLLLKRAVVLSKLAESQITKVSTYDKYVLFVQLSLLPATTLQLSSVLSSSQAPLICLLLVEMICLLMSWMLDNRIQLYTSTTSLRIC